MYTLNGEQITEARMTELVEDLAMFPYDKADIELPIKSRVEKYLAILKDGKELKLSDTLVLSVV